MTPSPGPSGASSPSAVGGEIAVAEEREVPVGEPAQQVRDVFRPVGRRRLRRAVGVEQAVGEQPVGQRTCLPDHRRGVPDDLANVVQHLRDVRLEPGRDAAAQVDVDPRLDDRPGRRGRRVAVGQDGAQLAVRRALHDHDGVDDPPGLAPGPSHRREDRLDQVGHVVRDDLEDRPAGLARRVADADQLLPRCPTPGQLAVRLGCGAQDRAGVPGADEVRGVAAVEGVEAGVDRVHGICGTAGLSSGAAGVGIRRRLRGGSLLTGPTDHVRAPRGSWLVLASAGLATSRVAPVAWPTRLCAPPAGIAVARRDRGARPQMLR